MHVIRQDLHRYSRMPMLYHDQRCLTQCLRVASVKTDYREIASCSQERKHCA